MRYVEQSVRETEAKVLNVRVNIKETVPEVKVSVSSVQGVKNTVGYIKKKVRDMREELKMTIVQTWKDMGDIANDMHDANSMIISEILKEIEVEIKKS